MSQSLSLNDVFHGAAARGLALDESLRVQSVFSTGYLKGPLVRLMVDYRFDGVDQPYYAYGTVVGFKHLSEAEFGRICKRAVRAHGRDQAAQIAAARQLLSRDDAVALFKDDKVLARPVLREVFGELSLESYAKAGLSSPGFVGQIPVDSIRKLRADLLAPAVLPSCVRSWNTEGDGLSL